VTGRSMMISSTASTTMSSHGRRRDDQAPTPRSVCRSCLPSSSSLILLLFAFKGPCELVSLFVTVLQFCMCKCIMRMHHTCLIHTFLHVMSHHLHTVRTQAQSS
jgi:hypothetical protein